MTLQKVALSETMLPKVTIPSVTLPEVAVTGSDITVLDTRESDITGSDITGCDITGSDIFIDVFHFNSVLFVPHIYIYILFVNDNIKFLIVLLKFPYILHFISIMYFLFNSIILT